MEDTNKKSGAIFFQLWVFLFVFLFFGVFFCFVVKNNPSMLGISPGSVWQERWYFLSIILTGGILLFIILFYFSSYLFGRKLYYKKRMLSAKNESGISVNLSREAITKPLRCALSQRYGLLWRRKVRLLLVIGEDEAISPLLPTLKTQQWLEGQRTVLIYGGSLSAEPDTALCYALRKLRRGRPLDGIVRLLQPEMMLTAERSEADIRWIEQFATRLGYQPPLYLWQHGQSNWPSVSAEMQSAGILLPRRVSTDNIAQEITELLPALRLRGMAQIASDSADDFLLRLAQRFEQGETARWQRVLTPWLYAAQQGIPLRGLFFFLPKQANNTANPSTLLLPALWHSVADDASRQRGYRTGLAWQRTLTVACIGAMAICAAGMLMAFVINRAHIISVAEKAQALMAQHTDVGQQLTDLHALRNEAERLQYYVARGAPWYQRFGMAHHSRLLASLLPWYGRANNRLIRDPASHALAEKLHELLSTAPGSDLRAVRAKAGYDQLKALLMMTHPDKADSVFFARTMSALQPAPKGVPVGLWQSLAPDLWSFYMATLPSQPEWKITPDSTLINQSRQVLLQQLGKRNAESTLYQTMLKSVRRNFADITLDDMTSNTDAQRLFITDVVVPGMFSRQAWEGEVQQAIEQVATMRRDEIDWVLSDSRQSLAEEISPEALKERLAARYFSDFAASWLNFLNSLRWQPVHNIADVTDQLTLMSDIRQSPLIALMNTLAFQGQTGQPTEGVSDTLLRSARDLISQKEKPVFDQRSHVQAGPLDETFGPLLSLMGKNSAGGVTADSNLSLQTYLTRVTRVRLRLQQIAASADPLESMQNLAQTVFQGKSIDLTDTQQYGSLIAASLGEEWGALGNTLFVQPLTQAWQTVLQPSSASLNLRWKRAVVTPWQTAFNGRFPFSSGKSEVSLPMLAEFIRKDSGRIERFLSTELSGVLHKEGSHWVVDATHTQGLTFNPDFLKALAQLNEISDILFTDGNQGISFELQAQPTADVVETRLTIDGQQLHYFNQMPGWQVFRWPGESYKPGTMLSWSSTSGGARLFGDYSGTWGFIRWLEQGKSKRLDNSQWILTFSTTEGKTLQWVLRSQLGSGPLVLLSLRGFALPEQIFIEGAQPLE
ncbi:MAG: hypothetical protein XXXJIFNMEKO3_02710 [Candidatus Erwinia impunctatus]